jgi:aspartyl-tRNA(Asn)/glutamyl-tRNA(Gln) amidotransferase subunit A
MTKRDITALGARGIAEAVNAGGISAFDSIRRHLEIIAARNPALNVLVAVDAERSLREADRVDARVAAGEVLPLAGVPLIVKDNIWAEGWPITQGSRLFSDFVAACDAKAVALARAAGAIVVGIGACSELACKGVTNTPLHGITHHPQDPALTPGGSSGGNAAALAAGMAPIALGTDAGGSSRRPPAHCGVVGFKPGQDVVPYGPGFSEPFWGVSVIAPMGRTVDDCALLFSVLTGLPPDTPGPLRFAYNPTFGIRSAIDDDVALALETAVDTLRCAGWTVDPVDVVWPDGVGEEALMPLQHAGLALLYGDSWQKAPNLFDPDVGAQIKRGLALSGTDVIRALDQSYRLRGALDGLFGDYDLLIGLTTPCTAWPHDRLGPQTIGGVPAAPRDHAALTPRFNHAQLPALSLPCGAGRSGLPVGMQIVGPRGSDAIVLAAARQAEIILSHPAT